MIFADVYTSCEKYNIIKDKQSLSGQLKCREYTEIKLRPTINLTPVINKYTNLHSNVKMPTSNIPQDLRSVVELLPDTYLLSKALVLFPLQSNLSAIYLRLDSHQLTTKTNHSFPTEKISSLSKETIMIKFIKP